MVILLIILGCFGFGMAAFFLMAMADGRRLRGRMREPRPAFMPEEAEPDTPLATSRCAL